MNSEDVPEPLKLHTAKDKVLSVGLFEKNAQKGF